MTPEFGEGIHREISLRQKDLYGILNGIDTGFFNPETDKYIAHTYSVSSWKEGKALNKKKLQQKLDLDEISDIPIFGMVTRLAKQKGLDLVIEGATTLAKDGEVVILGVGDVEIEQQLQEVSAKHPKRFACELQFNASLAQQIYAGSDFFLMPSRFEPCGLGQLIAMRYGTVPVVRKTGGLADTVVDGVTGVVFDEMTSQSFTGAIHKALSWYRNQKKWPSLVQSAIQQDFSWQKSAKEYATLYEEAVQKHRG